MKLLVPLVHKFLIRSVPTRLPQPSNAFIGASLSRQTAKPWICRQCRQRSQFLGQASNVPFENSARNEHDQTSLLQLKDLKPQTSLLRRVYSTCKEKSSTEVARDGSKAVNVKLPSHEEGRRSHISKRFSHLMDNMQTNIFFAGQRLNDLTGYSGIEILKKEIEEQEELVRTTRLAVQKAKEAYTQAIAQRSASQREVNELLQRKHLWSPQDLERFTALFTSDHANEQQEAAAQQALLTAESKAEEASAKLSSSILARYHEEQIWSDKIRRMSTWGTWGLMGVNILLFVVFQIGVEPWRRKRLVKGFEEKVVQALERESAATNATTGAALAALQAGQVNTTSGTLKEESSHVAASPEVWATVDSIELAEQPQAITPASTQPEEIMSEPWSIARMLGIYKAALCDLFSERPVVSRKVDLTAKAIEGFGFGIALTCIFAAIIRSR